MKQFLYLVLFALLSHKVLCSEDSLRIETQKTLSVKSNVAILIMQGFSLQTEYAANERTGYWIETTFHREEHSTFNAPLKETNFLLGINRYKIFKNPIGTKTHNGIYWGPYLKFRQGVCCLSKEIDYSAAFLGLQAGIQSVSKQNIIFTIGTGYGIGYFIKKAELTYSTFFERYHLPILDFRASVSVGYLF